MISLAPEGAFLFHRGSPWSPTAGTLLVASPVRTLVHHCTPALPVQATLNEAKQDTTRFSSHVAPVPSLLYACKRSTAVGQGSSPRRRLIVPHARNTPQTPRCLRLYRRVRCRDRSPFTLPKWESQSGSTLYRVPSLPVKPSINSF